MHRPSTRAVALSLTTFTALVVAACGDSSSSSSPSPSAASGGSGAAGTIAIQASEYKFAGVPATTNGGVLTTTLENAGKQSHDAQLLRLDAGHTAADAVTALKGDAVPAFIHAVGGPSIVLPGKTSSSTQTVGPGNYVFVCFQQDMTPSGGSGAPTGAASPNSGRATPAGYVTGPPNAQASGSAAPSGSAGSGGPPPGQGRSGPPPHFALGMVAPLTVTGGSATDPLPASDATVTAKDYAFTVPTLKTGKSTITFRNTGPNQLHEAKIYKLAPGVTVDSIKKLIASSGPDQSGPPPFEEIGGAMGFDPGGGGNADINLQPGGNYAFFCFIPDRTGGPPHAIGHGMITPITLAP